MGERNSDDYYANRFKSSDVRRAFQSGYTLVEISIVLVVIGLLVGGILAGHSLIRQSALQSVVSEASQYKSAIIRFKDKYHDYPGDMSDAQDYWGASTNNGNGNHIIEAASAASTSGEAFEFWNQLSLSGEIAGHFTGKSGPAAVMDTVPKVNAPASHVSNAGWGVTNLTNYAGDNNSYAFNYGNVITFGSASTGNPTIAGAMKPDEAWNIDTKIDDGKPASGSIIAVEAAGFLAAASTKCTTSNANNDYTGVYNSSGGSQKSCAMYLIIPELNGQVAAAGGGSPPAAVNGACDNSTPLGCASGPIGSDNGQTACGTTHTWVCAGTNGGSDSASCSYTNAACPTGNTCNNSMALGCTSGGATNDNGLTACGTTRTWNCGSSSCSFTNGICPANGVCNNSAPLACSAGNATTDNGQTACGTTHTWVCAGTNGGSNSGTCSYNNAACATVNGSCNNSVALGCSAGTPSSDNGQTACGTTHTWICAGANGGTNSGACSYSNSCINGVCINGVALGCSAGTPGSDNGQMACGTTRTWICAGIGGGTDSSTCSLANAACPHSCVCTGAGPSNLFSTSPTDVLTVNPSCY
jgi:prepilin-type N-terminal cleavage/methylation domain-containing protein